MAGRRCTVCTHDDVAAIEKALAAAESTRRIAARFNLAETSLRRHKAACVRRIVARAARAEKIDEAHRGAATIDEIRKLAAYGLELLELAAGQRVDGKLQRQKFPGGEGADVKAASAALTATLRTLSVQAQMLGEIQTGTTVNVLVDQRGKPRPEWAEMTRAIFEALRPYPEAARAVAAKLGGSGAVLSGETWTQESAETRGEFGAVEVG